MAKDMKNVIFDTDGSYTKFLALSMNYSLVKQQNWAKATC